MCIYHVYSQKHDYFCIFCWWQQKINHSLGKIFKCVWKILFSSFRKCYGVFVSELPLARCQPFDIGNFRWLNSFFYIFTLKYLTNTNSKSLLTTPFLAELKNFFHVHLNILPILWRVFCFHQQKTQNISNFLHFDHNI